MQSKYKDVSDYKTRWADMGALPDVDLQELDERANEVKEHMQTCRYPLNNNQLAVTLFAAKKLEEGEKRQIYTIPAGQGKSRVIVGIIAALCLALKTNSKRGLYTFCVVYNH